MQHHALVFCFRTFTTTSVTTAPKPTKDAKRLLLAQMWCARRCANVHHLGLSETRSTAPEWQPQRLTVGDMRYNSYMNLMLRIPLNTSPDQLARLQALQIAFAQVCNALAPTVQQTKVWNRVALHHLMYRTLRSRFPEMGSQMVCNAIYSVSRTCRLVFQNPQSPLNLARLGDKPLPMLRFADNCPVYFDRHTLSVKAGQLSMYTLDGRIRFALALTPANESIFNEKKLREIVLSRKEESRFELSFLFSDGEEDTPEPGLGSGAEVPEYVLVEETP